MSDSPMKCLVSIGHQPHPIKREYGMPYLALYWASKRFVDPGLYLWTGKRNVRVLPPWASDRGGATDE